MAGHTAAALLVVLLLLHTANCQEVLSQEVCPDLQTVTIGLDVLETLIDPCRYDRWTMPGNNSEPLPVAVRMHIYFLGPIEPSNLHFTAHILLRLRWLDERLRFEHLDITPNVTQIVREGSPRNELWIPHLYIVNEQDSVVMGADRQDVLLAVEPDGTVMLSTRMKITVFCIMNLQRFPFDHQECPLFLESWTYNSNELTLFWEPDTPVTVNRDLHLTEYRLVNLWSNFTIANYSLRSDISTSFSLNSRAYGKFGGDYSSLTLRFDLAREVGYHIMDYYVPSILIVAVSWVSFWLDPNAVPGRVTLGTSTMLTFITLSRNIGSSLPKVSYIKSTEIWFIVCTLFIFGSLVEFAFSNTIWRRKNDVELKKYKSKYILKSAVTPQPSRRKLNESSSTLDRTQSMPSVAQTGSSGYLSPSDSNTFTVGSTESMKTEPTMESKNDLMIPVPILASPQDKVASTTMTSQEIAEWIDRRSRIWFPVLFLIFNVLYWGFVWI